MPDPGAISPIRGYIEGFEEPRRTALETMYGILKAAAPGAQEKISYQMPTLYLHGNLVHFAAQARHLGFYPAPSAIEAFAAELAPYATSKGAVQFPYDAPLPQDLIRRMVAFRVRENLARHAAKSPRGTSAGEGRAP